LLWINLFLFLFLVISPLMHSSFLDSYLTTKLILRPLSRARGFEFCLFLIGLFCVATLQSPLS
jgi:hypothetical protein